MSFTCSSAIPASAGIGLRAPHYRELLDKRPALGWLEVHSENYFGDGGQPLHFLQRAREGYPLSLHGVGLSLGSTDPLDESHLRKLKRLIERFEPGLVSEHLCWNSFQGRHFHDLLPLPYSEATLEHVCARVDATQAFLQRPILIENITSYVPRAEDEMGEAQFLNALAQKTGCGVLLDINNLYVNQANGGCDASQIIDAINPRSVAEIHLAGFDYYGDSHTLVDTHGKPVCDAVWQLYRRAIARFGSVPTLIEWDTDLPALEVLLAEAHKAQTILEQTNVLAA